MKKILAKLVSFNTVADRQNQQIISWIEKFLSKQGFQTQKMVSKRFGKANLWARFKNKKKTGLTFMGHTDTVPAGENWKKDPFKLVQKGDKIFGLGTSDMKGGIAAFLSAIERMDLSLLSKNIEAVFTFNEEGEFDGIKSFLRKKKIGSETVFVGEPTNNIPIVSTKGIVSLEIEFFGKSVHASNPSKGINAVSMAMEFIQEIENFSKATLEKEKNRIFAPGYTTFNLGKISGGDVANKVPERCLVGMEWRTVSPGQEQEIKKKVNSIIRKRKMNAKILIGLVLKPMIVDKKLRQEIERALGRKSRSENYATEGSFLQTGTNVVILGPGPMNAHVADEFVSFSSLLESVNVYQKIIKHYCE